MHLDPRMDFSQLISDTKLLAGDIKHENGIKWDYQIKGKLPKLLAHIFALWTVKNSGLYFDAII